MPGSHLKYRQEINLPGEQEESSPSSVAFSKTIWVNKSSSLVLVFFRCPGTTQLQDLTKTEERMSTSKQIGCWLAVSVPDAVQMHLERLGSNNIPAPATEQ